MLGVRGHDTVGLVCDKSEAHPQNPVSQGDATVSGVPNDFRVSYKEREGGSDAAGRVTKVALIGASGKIGRQVAQSLYECPHLDKKIVMTLIARNANRIEGMLLDLQSTSYLETHRAKNRGCFTYSDDVASVTGSDLVVICAGTWASHSEKKKYASMDPQGRLVQAYANDKMIYGLAKALKQHASPHTDYLVVTNQSDLLAERLRGILPPERVFGFGGMVDGARFRLNLDKYSSGQITEGRIVGYHCDLMVPIGVKGAGGDAEVVHKSLEETIGFGGRVSKLQKDRRHPAIDSGSSILPGSAIAQTILAYSGVVDPLIDSFNVRLDEQCSKHFGLPNTLGVGVPLKISERSMRVWDDLSLSNDEQKKLVECMAVFKQRYSMFIENADMASELDSFTGDSSTNVR